MRRMRWRGQPLWAGKGEGEGFGWARDVGRVHGSGPDARAVLTGCGGFEGLRWRCPNVPIKGKSINNAPPRPGHTFVSFTRCSRPSIKSTTTTHVKLSRGLPLRIEM